MNKVAIAPALDLFNLERFQRAAAGTIAVNGHLESEALCRQAVAEIGRSLVSATSQQALSAAKTMIAMYPKAKVQDAEGYVRSAVVAFGRCPPDLLPRAVDRLTNAHRWYPSKADISAVVDELVRPRREALRGAKLMLEQHERRRRERERREEVARSKAEVLARWGSFDAFFKAIRCRHKQMPFD